MGKEYCYLIIIQTLLYQSIDYFTNSDLLDGCAMLDNLFKKINEVLND